MKAPTARASTPPRLAGRSARVAPPGGPTRLDAFPVVEAAPTP